MVEAIEEVLVEEEIKDPKENPNLLSKVGIHIARAAIEEGDLATQLEVDLVD